MKIAHIVHCLDPSHGGPPHVAMRMSAALAARGHEVHLVGARLPRRDDVVRATLDAVPGIDRVNVHVTDMPPGRIAQLRTSHIVDPLRAIGPVDAAHFHGVWGNDVSAASRVLRAWGSPYVVRPAGMLDHWTLRQKPLRKKIALATSTGRMLRGAGAIQALNAHERDAIEQLSLATRVVVIPNGVFVQEIDRPTEPGAFRAAHPDVGDRPFVLFLSRLHYKKGLDILAEAWKRVHAQAPEWALVVAGPREDDSIDAFRESIDGAGLSGSVVETGALYGQDKVGAIRECEFFALPTRQEGFSIAVTEALALGCPVVTTHDCHFPEITEAGAGIETSLDPGEFADAMLRLVRDDAFRSSAGEHAASLVRERFVWPEIAASLESLYTDIGPGGSA